MSWGCRLPGQVALCAGGMSGTLKPYELKCIIITQIEDTGVIIGLNTPRDILAFRMVVFSCFLLLYHRNTIYIRMEIQQKKQPRRNIILSLLDCATLLKKIPVYHR